MFTRGGNCGNLSCTSMHFQALSCNGRLPNLFGISYLRSKQGTHNAGVEGSIPSLSTKFDRFVLTT
jgi:hypothetical protein